MSAQRAYELGPGLRDRRARPTPRPGQGGRRPGQPQRAAGGPGHPPRHPQGPRPPAARGRDPGGGLPRTGRAHRRRQGGPGGLQREARADLDGEMTVFTTIRYETSPDKVATITLNRPEVLNAFDRRMCEEVRAAWRLVKDDPGVNAVVLRAEGRPRLLRRARHQEALRPARRRLEPRGPRRAVEPEVAEGLEAGRLCGPGPLHRRRVLLRQRVRHRHLLAGGHVLRLARERRPRLGPRARRPHAPDRPGPHPAHGPVGQRRTGRRGDRACRSAW